MVPHLGPAFLGPAQQSGLQTWLRSHMGWLFDADGTKIRRDKKNAKDLSRGPCAEERPCGDLTKFGRFAAR